MTASHSTGADQQLDADPGVSLAFRTRVATQRLLIVVALPVLGCPL
jgi:hypothetical protein